MVFTFAANAYEQRIKDIDIRLQLNGDGSARVTEKWDITASEGTEWYLVRSNLGEIKIKDFSVTENGKVFVNEGDWDVDRSIKAKEGRCGIVRKSNGVELCWGLGSHGSHLFNVEYTMTNVVESLNDCDLLHLQLVSPGLSAQPEHVLVTIEAPGTQIDTTNTLAWGFGFTGGTLFKDGKLYYGSTEKFRHNSSVIALVRFEKGMFNPQTSRNQDFSEVYDIAMEGADFGSDDDDEPTALQLILTFFSVIAGIIGFGALVSRANQKKVLGCLKKEVTWSRDVPMGGDLAASDWILKQLGESNTNNPLASALILKMIYNNNLTVSKDSKGKIEISFNDAAYDSLDSASKGLYDMMKAASGSDVILQDKEFSRWSKRNVKKVNNWVTKTYENAEKRLADNRLKYTPEGQAQARKLLGFKKYLKDFTLSNERDVVEVKLWKDLLVYASLFGIAEAVAKQLKDINPQAFEEEVMFDYVTMNHLLRSTDVLARSITNAVKSAAASSGAAGHGGSTSFGGGGGFHGGGFGGGAR